MSVEKITLYTTEDGSSFLTEAEAVSHENRIDTNTQLSRTNEVLGNGISDYSRRVWPKYPLFGVITDSDSNYSDTLAYEAFDSYFLDIPNITKASYGSTKYVGPSTMPLDQTMILGGSFSPNNVFFNYTKVDPSLGTNVTSTNLLFDLTIPLPTFVKGCITGYGGVGSKSPEERGLDMFCNGGNFSGTTWGYRFPGYQIRESSAGKTGSTIFILNKLGQNTAAGFRAEAEMTNVSPVGSKYYGKTAFLSFSGK